LARFALSAHTYTQTYLAGASAERDVVVVAVSAAVVEGEGVADAGVAAY